MVSGTGRGGLPAANPKGNTDREVSAVGRLLGSPRPRIPDPAAAPHPPGPLPPSSSSRAMGSAPPPRSAFPFSSS